MEAPEHKDLILCEKCFAMMPSDAEYCAECGAPLSDAPGVAGSDAEVYPELAKANVLRMRKEFKAAEDICLAILRRFPNNASANTLLGDISVERGTLEQAVEWYELALDILPDSKENQDKLAAVRAKLNERQTQTTVENLGIPAKKPPYVLIALVTLIVVAFGIAGTIMVNNAGKGDDPNRPLVVQGQEDTGAKPMDPNQAAAQTPESVTPIYESDPELLSQLCQALALDPQRLPLVEVGNVDRDVRITLLVEAPDGEWPLRAKVVRKAFDLVSGTPRVELTVKDGDRTMTQSVNRETYNRTLDPAFDVLNEALLVEVLLGYRMPTPVAPVTDPVTPPSDPTNSLPPNTSGNPPSDDAARGGGA